MKECNPTMTWENAPETITPIHLAKIIGVGETTARNIFNRKDFPRIKGTGVKQLADKQMAHLWVKGINTSSDNNTLLISILDILEKINNKMEVENGEKNKLY